MNLSRNPLLPVQRPICTAGMGSENCCGCVAVEWFFRCRSRGPSRDDLADPHTGTLCLDVEKIPNSTNSDRCLGLCLETSVIPQEFRSQSGPFESAVHKYTRSKHLQSNVAVRFAVLRNFANS